MSSYLMDGYYGERSAATAQTSERVAFIRSTYAHLSCAILAFVGLEALLINSGIGKQFLEGLSATQGAWIGLMVLFIGGGFLAQYMARNTASKATQYMGLTLYVAIEVVFFLPILTICMSPRFPQFNAIPLQAGLLTLIVFGGLTAAVFISKKDFSFLGYGLWIVSLLALGLVVAAVIGGFGLGVWFAFAMVALAAGCILYDTSNVLHHYPTNAAVAASLELFASVALMFYYIIRIMMSFANSSD
jgi:FtsH-binding integral membrane protein